MTTLKLKTRNNLAQKLKKHNEAIDAFSEAHGDLCFNMTQGFGKGQEYILTSSKGTDGTTTVKTVKGSSPWILDPALVPCIHAKCDNKTSENTCHNTRGCAWDSISNTCTSAQLPVSNAWKGRLFDNKATIYACVGDGVPRNNYPGSNKSFKVKRGDIIAGLTQYYAPIANGTGSTPGLECALNGGKQKAFQISLPRRGGARQAGAEGGGGGRMSE